MSASSLKNKTVRPGSFTGYSYYHSDRNGSKSKSKTQEKHHSNKLVYLLFFITIIAIGVYYSSHAQSKSLNTADSTSTTSSSTKVKAPVPLKSTPAVTAAAPNQCSGNALPKLIIVSISKRHLWACQINVQEYDSPVVTGMTMYPDTLTPPGIYHIYAFETDKTLTGTSSAGSWSDPVSYWMPFLDNQYGEYGFHDATWRAPSDFGNIDPNSTNASHGCVELPLATAKWIYNWAILGTTVEINS